MQRVRIRTDVRSTALKASVANDWISAASRHGSAAVRRTFDIVCAGAAFVLVLPVFVAIAIAIRIAMGGPVFYGQVRPGLHERPFRVWKFRTMTAARGSDGRLLSDGERLTPLGRWLRERSLDELPQLVNVLAGEMSLVGPRPLLFRYLQRYTPRQRLRHTVKPGITGWAQVNGRNAADWTTRLEHDAWYAENRSLALDLRILWMTIAALSDRHTVFAGAGAELDEFWGQLGAPATGPRAFPVDVDERM
jgi:lipopolysaccharide/colanic/teichoic acid biosynthesis glycosyltransferase